MYGLRKELSPVPTAPCLLFLLHLLGMASLETFGEFKTWSHQGAFGGLSLKVSSLGWGVG